MAEGFAAVWFSTPDGRSIYAHTAPDRVLEHQRMGARYAVHEMVVKTYADRLHIAALLERLQSGLMRPLTEDEYRLEVSNIERLERFGAS
jgi:hypothetical protein